MAYLIDTGTNSVPLLMSVTGMPKRTLQGTLLALTEIDIICDINGGTKNRTYSITSWGMINKKEVESNLQHIKEVLE